MKLTVKQCRRPTDAAETDATLRCSPVRSTPRRLPVFEDEGNAKKRGVSLSDTDCSGCHPQRVCLIPSKPLVQGATTAQPVPGPAPVVNGSIFQTAQPINYGYQPLFEDRRPRNVGDTLTIVLQENVSASKSSSANASRDGKTNFGFDTVPRYLQGLFGNARADVEPLAAIPLTVKVARMPAIPLAAR